MEKCNVLFPGKFKPVHSGHIALMEKYLNSSEYDVYLTIIISKSPKEGLTPEASKWFLDKIYARNPKVKVIISPDPSPIGTVYNMTGEKELGDGIYAIGCSAKGDDITRAEAFANKFAEGGKYYTPGVTTIVFPINPEPALYYGRKDAFNNGPISSTVVRNDIRNNDYESFRTAYLPMLEDGMINEALLKEYFTKVSAELLPAKETKVYDNVNESCLYYSYEPACALNEGGAAGHMEHPYDVNDFTFSDLKDLIIDLFAGKITDITEKLDGQNLFASVDNYGNTIFARTPAHIHQTPWLLNDIMNNPKWIGKPSVQHAYSNAALTVDKVFKNIPKAAEFFNYDDKADGVRYRKWLNLEILDTENFNVIPYVESKISFHGFKVAVFDYSEKDAFSKDDKSPYSLIEDPNYDKDMEVLQKAISKTNRTTFKAQITPEVIFKTVENGEARANKYIVAIDKMLAKYDLPDNATIANYKVEGICDFIENSYKYNFISGDLLDGLIRRLVFGDKSTPINKLVKVATTEDGELITKEQYALLREFENDIFPILFKKIMKLLDNLFITLGNEALKSIQGLANAGHEQEVVKRLRKEMKEIQDAILNSDDAKKKEKLEQNLQRLAVVNNELNATEGIVFNYNGHTLKLTGSFAPLNQIFGTRFAH